jgi:hypothetical protein
LEVQTGAGVLSDVTTAEENAQRIHRELLQLIETYSEEAASDQTSSVSKLLPLIAFSLYNCPQIYGGFSSVGNRYTHRLSIS